MENKVDNSEYLLDQSLDPMRSWHDDINELDIDSLLPHLSNEITILDGESYFHEPNQFGGWLNTLANLLQPTYFILQELVPMIVIVLITRILHLFIDLIFPRHRIFKDLITCGFGCCQILNYLSKIDETGTATYMVITVILLYSTFTQSPILTCKPDNILNSKFQIILALIIAAPILINEYFIYCLKFQFHANLRSIMMTLSMKLTSQINDQPATSKSFISSLAHLVHPASCIFGPWHRITLPQIKTEHETRADFLICFKRQMKFTFKLAVKTLSILILSGSIIDFISEVLTTHYQSSVAVRILDVYLTALEFRFSHYFICSLISCLLALWSESETNHFICVISLIEWPRSMIQVVVNWNIPVHNWLKMYIFYPVKARTNHIIIPILVTYFVSSTLHGFKFHIWIVLFSLGFITYIEKMLRSEMAIRLNACIKVESCIYTTRGNCLKGHTRTEKNSYLVNLINFCFRILTIVHLAYLGYIFKGNTDEERFVDAMHSWSGLYFYSHVITVVSYAILLLL